MGMAPITPAGGDDFDIGAGYRPLSEINVTPFVDVMLVLLIVFMVAAPLMMVGVPVNLPKTSAAEISSDVRRPIVVSVDLDGRVYLREEELAPDIIRPRLAELAAQDPEAVVYVRGDRNLSYGRIMEVMGIVSTAGFSKVSLIAQGEAGSGPAVPAP
jgi:biopolymer transport protein TolR